MQRLKPAAPRRRESAAKAVPRPVSVLLKWVHTRNPNFLACLLGLSVFAAYLPVLRNGFIIYDDPYYIYSNPHVQQGLSWASIRWAFTTFDMGFWHPLTWASILMDSTVFGLHPAGHHLTSLALHVANTLLLFYLLLRATGATWRSILVAAFFGLHPLHIESVAWSAERKDVLSTLFFLLALWAYVRFANDECRMTNDEGRMQGGGAKRTTDHGTRTRSHLLRFTFHVSRFYLLSLVCFVFALMSKTVVVTLPVLLLLLDYWPLKRMKNGEWRMGNARAGAQPIRIPHSAFVILEKLPFFGLSLVAGVITLYAQAGTGVIRQGAQFPFLSRAANAALAYVGYLVQTCWPAGLSVYYPFPRNVPFGLAAGAVLLLVTATAAILFAARTRPYLLVGWVWYLVTLLPVIGLVPFGGQAHADRYSYVPLIGFFLLVVWGASDCAVHWRLRTAPLAIAAVLAIGCCSLLTWRQLGYWRESKTLFVHALAVTGDDPLLHNNLGAAFSANNQWDAAVFHFQKALALQPDDALAQGNLGVALANEGQWDDAINELQKAISLRPEIPLTQAMLGAALVKKGRLDEAISHLELAVKLQPDYVLARRNLAVALGTQGRPAEAIAVLEKTLQLMPNDVESRYDLAVLLAASGRADEAINQYQQVIKLDPAHAEAHNNLGALYGAKGRFDDAIVEFQQSLRLRPGFQKAEINLEAARAAKAKQASPKPPR
jgi:protein O-mannosyl-transferase